MLKDTMFIFGPPKWNGIAADHNMFVLTFVVYVACTDRIDINTRQTKVFFLLRDDILASATKEREKDAAAAAAAT
jgi:hypothetical protein